MSTPLMFKAVDIGQTLSSIFFSPMTVSWNIQTHRILYKSDGDKFTRGQIFWLIESFIFFGVLGIGALAVDILYLKNASADDPLYMEISKSSHMITSRIVVGIMNIGGCAFVLGATKWGDEIGSVSNGFLDFEQIMKRRLHEKDTVGRDIYGILLMVVLFFSITAPPIPAIITVTRGQDPLYTIFHLILPSKLFTYSSFRVCLYLLRLAVILKQGYEIGRVLALLAFILLLFCRVLIYTIQMLVKFYDQIGNERKLRGEHVSVYNQFWLLLRITTRCNSGPILLGCVIIEILFMTFAVILVKLRHRQPLPIIIISATLVWSMALGLFILLPMGVAIHDESVEMIHNWTNDYRVKGSNKSYLRKKLKTMKKFYYFVGYEEFKMYVVDRDNATKFAEGIVMHTADVLLTTG